MMRASSTPVLSADRCQPAGRPVSSSLPPPGYAPAGLPSVDELRRARPFGDPSVASGSTIRFALIGDPTTDCCCVMGVSSDACSSGRAGSSDPESLGDEPTLLAPEVESAIRTVQQEVFAEDASAAVGEVLHGILPPPRSPTSDEPAVVTTAAGPNRPSVADVIGNVLHDASAGPCQSCPMARGPCRRCVVEFFRPVHPSAQSYRQVSAPRPGFGRAVDLFHAHSPILTGVYRAAPEPPCTSCELPEARCRRCILEEMQAAINQARRAADP